MSVESFRAASEAAERWARSLSEFCYFAEEGNPLVALVPIQRMRADLDQHGPTIDAAKERLCGIADAPIRHQGRTGIRVYPSAHEAVLEIARFAVDVLLVLSGLSNPKLPHDWQERAARQVAHCWDHFRFNTSEMTSLIRRERAKYLLAEPASTPPVPTVEATPNPSTPPTPPLFEGPDWYDLKPQIRRMLRFMRDREQADIAAFVEAVWEKDYGDVEDSAIAAAISRANTALGKQGRNYPRQLEKVRGEPIVRWF